jgi:putative metallohydrolase (TIGR04338 family)
MKAKPLPKVIDVERYVAKVFKSRRVQASFPKSMQWRSGLPSVSDGRGRSKACGWYGGIKIPLWARNEGIVLHELAHVICQREYNSLTIAGHGWQFCAIYLRLVLCMMGREAHDALKREMKLNRVRFAPPRKSKPLDPERRAALIARLATYRTRSRATQGVSGRFAGLELEA